MAIHHGGYLRRDVFLKQANKGPIDVHFKGNRMLHVETTKPWNDARSANKPHTGGFWGVHLQNFPDIFVKIISAWGK